MKKVNEHVHYASDISGFSELFGVAPLIEVKSYFLSYFLIQEQELNIDSYMNDLF